MDLVSFAFLFGDLIVTEDEVHVVILFCERYYTLSISENTTELIDWADFVNLMSGTEWINENAYPIGAF